MEEGRSCGKVAVPTTSCGPVDEDTSILKKISKTPHLLQEDGYKPASKPNRGGRVGVVFCCVMQGDCGQGACCACLGLCLF